ncbi:Ribonuclease H-like domain containing protein [Trema orientale]|uniref:Ribonuclease H-like domain containing protein n=1 Tax=Trema orientale TaxID=63057 RepID=A0A2P5D390_TREOI|nr:Ribonuclease H-like domain containing protein [Trema orientale]
MVSDFISHLGVWNEEAIRAHCYPVDYEAILAIPLCFEDTIDKLIWYYDRSGRSYLEEFHLFSSHLAYVSSLLVHPHNGHWLSLVHGQLKLNSDVVIRDGTRFIGACGIIRDSSGIVLLSWAVKIQDNFSVILGELMAMREGLRIALEKGFSVSIIETDATEVISLFRSCDSFSPFFSVIFDIRQILSSARISSCCHVSRFGNMVAHFLASSAFVFFENKI